MHSTEVIGYAHDGAIYCIDCAQHERKDEEGGPIFAGAEYDTWTGDVCDSCGEFLEGHESFPSQHGGGYYDRFDIVSAHYCHAVLFHEGLGSKLYQRLSRMGRYFKPGLHPDDPYSLSSNAQDILADLVRR